MQSEGAGALWLTFVVEALFTAVFVRVLATYLRRPDGLRRDVVVMFSALAVLFVLGVLGQMVGEPPRSVSVAASVLLLGQPFLMLRVVRWIGPVPDAVYWSALTGWMVSGGVLAFGGEELGPWSLLVVIGVFVVTEITAAWFLGRLALSRTGASRARLWLTAVATASFAAAIVVAGAGGSDQGAPAQRAQQLAGILALFSAAGYLLAFAPPKWARRSWSNRAAYDVVRQLIQAPPDRPAEEIWQRYAVAVCRATSSSGVVILTCTDKGVLDEVARVGAPAPVHQAGSAPACGDLIAFSGSVSVGDRRQTAPAIVLEYARAGGFRFVTAAPLRLSTGPAVLLLLSAYSSLFTDDDVQLLGELAAQAAALGQRADLLTDRDRLTGELSATVAALTIASKAKSDFMANMSHELRTPLNAIIGFSDLMRTEPAADGQTTVPTEWIGHIHSSGSTCSNLINEVLDLAKVESGNIELRREPLDLPQAVARRSPA